MNSTLRAARLPLLLVALGLAGGSACASAAPARGDGSGPGSGPETPDQAYPPAGSAWVIFGADTAVAEVARTAEQREAGLMYRENLAENAGMLFVFDNAEVRSFWMQNTYIPLDIAYLNTDMRIINILAMEPQSSDLYESAGPTLFALEMNQGWFAARGIGPGAKAVIVFGR